MSDEKKDPAIEAAEQKARTEDSKNRKYQLLQVYTGKSQGGQDVTRLCVGLTENSGGKQAVFLQGRQGSRLAREGVPDDLGFELAFDPLKKIAELEERIANLEKPKATRRRSTKKTEE